jgi:hypothetical protein
MIFSENRYPLFRIMLEVCVGSRNDPGWRAVPRFSSPVKRPPEKSDDARNGRRDASMMLAMNLLARTLNRSGGAGLPPMTAGVYDPAGRLGQPR